MGMNHCVMLLWNRKQHKAAAAPGNQGRIVQDITDLVVISSLEQKQTIQQKSYLQQLVCVYCGKFMEISKICIFPYPELLFQCFIILTLFKPCDVLVL